MTTFNWRRGTLRHAAPLALIAVVVAGCASGSSVAKSGASPVAMSSMSGMSGMSMAPTPDAAGAAAASSEAAAAGDSGITPVPTQVLGTAVWQGMKITADAMTPVPFDIYNGTTMQLVKPPKNVSFHLMVLLNDARTNVVIPYASVWGTIKEGSNTPFDESLWPMISRYMGPHYGNDVVLPGSGTYQLSLLISPPVSARHVEYQGVWLKPHTVTFTFHWHQPS
ncbi:MAG: iron transporter [Trebonia sp.]